MRPKILQSLREDTIPQLLDKTHRSPTDAFLSLQGQINEYGYTYQELGISLKNALSLAVFCQNNVLLELAVSLGKHRTRLIELSSNTALSNPEWAEKTQREVLIDFTETLRDWQRATEQATVLRNTLEIYATPSSEPELPDVVESTR